MLGSGPSYLAWLAENYQRPFDYSDSTQQVWGLTVAAFTSHCHLGFNMHLPEVVKKHNFVNAMKGSPETKFLMPEPIEDLPNTYEYPLAEIVEATGQVYFAHGFSYAVAFAIACGVEQLDLFGCDFNYAKTIAYEKGRGCAEYWLGIASERGIAVSVPQAGLLLDARKLAETGPYGYGNKRPQVELRDGKPRLTSFDTPPVKLELVEKSIG